jgi:hypothetical protein
MGCAALLGAAIALPVGIMVGAGGGAPARNAAGPSRPPAADGERRTARNPFSPRVAGDPFVVDEQRKVLRALETSCRQLGQHCDEAGQARRRIEEAEAGR